MPHTFRLPILAVALLVAVPAAAQTAPRELRVRMGQLDRALETGDDGTKLIRFFPRESPLTIVRTPDPEGAAGPVLRRVLRPDSVRAHLKSTDTGCALGGVMSLLTGEWRYVGGGQFTSRRGKAGPSLSLGWARERGVWVVRRISEEYYIPRPVLGTAVGELSRDTTAYAWLPEERRYAAATEWYRTHQPVVVHDRWLMKYGLPRRLGREELDPVGTLGVVPFFAEKGTGQAPEVVYALVGPGEYQPYQRTGDTLEDICGEWW
ncbi:MAG TPA: hypothetical protein VF710_16745 [Longimicrobium sp.]|jgi:hypothetical protein